MSTVSIISGWSAPGLSCRSQAGKLTVQSKMSLPKFQSMNLSSFEMFVIRIQMTTENQTKQGR